MEQKAARSALSLSKGCALLTSVFLLSLRVTSGEEPPNIVLIVADDLGWADVGYQDPASRYATPHIDQLAREGLRFDRFYIEAANCAPSRATFLTGTYPPRHRVYVPQGLARGGPTAKMRFKVPTQGEDESFHTFPVSINQVPPEMTSLAELLREAGYATARLGKWHIGDDHQGFDLNSANGEVGFTTNAGGTEQRFYSDVHVAERLTDTAIRFMEDNRDRPFFLYLAHWEVHTPLAARDERVAHFRERYEAAGLENLDPVYAAEIEQVDRSVGRVLEALERLGRSEDTLVLFTSDNGAVSRISANHPLRGGKGTFYEGGIRVPLCLRWPDRVEPGRRVDLPAHGVDLLPTFAELSGVPLPDAPPVDGISLLPLILGEAAPAFSDRPIFFHFPLYLGGGGVDQVLPAYDGTPNLWRAVPSSTVIRGDWKLIRYHEYERSTLYNLKEDPRENRDLALSHQDTRQEMEDLLWTWIRETGAPVPKVSNSAAE